MNWAPSIRLEDGMEKTYKWIYDQMSGKASVVNALPRRSRRTRDQCRQRPQRPVRRDRVPPVCAWASAGYRGDCNLGRAAERLSCTAVSRARALSPGRRAAAPCRRGDPAFPPIPKPRTPTMITLFTLPKPFVGHIGMIQRNAIQSWTRLHPDIDILMFGNEQGTAEIAAEFGLRHFPDVDVNEYGTPLMTGYFQQAEEAARHSRMCYVNADIVLFPDLLEAVAKVDLPKFVMGGQRTDYDIEKPIDFSRPDWAEALPRGCGREWRPAWLPAGSTISCIPAACSVRSPGSPWAAGIGTTGSCIARVVSAERSSMQALRDGDSPEPRLQSHRRPGSKDESRNQGGIESFGNRLLVKSILMTLEDADWQVDRYGLSRTFRWTRWHLLNEAALQAEIHEFPAFDSQTARVDRAPAVGPELEATLCRAALGAARIDRLNARVRRSLRLRR